MYQVISYERDRYDYYTSIRNHRQMGVKSFPVAVSWLKKYRFAELRKSSARGFVTIAINRNGEIIWRDEVRPTVNGEKC